MSRLEELMVKSYVRLVKAGRRSIDDVPENLKEAVTAGVGTE